MEGEKGELLLSGAVPVRDDESMVNDCALVLLKQDGKFYVTYIFATHKISHFNFVYFIL
jgi:hypothetical protein